MTEEDERWIQRFNNFLHAYSQIQAAALIADQRPLPQLEAQVLIHAFEFTHELVWNTLKDFLKIRGAQSLYSSKDTTRLAYKEGLIGNRQAWLDMIQSRNLTTHTYDEATVAQIIASIQNDYVAEFEQFRTRMNQLKNQ